MIEQVLQFMEGEGVPARSRILIGVSGGLDSTVLCRILAEHYEVEIAHVNYGLRPSAVRDQNFVAKLAEDLGCPFHLHHVEEKELSESDSLQEGARNIRYSFFEQIAEREQIPYVALAHHADDQAETILINLIRGSGVEGLAGMPSVRILSGEVRLLRPLLQATRSEIRAFAVGCGWEWMEDPTNEDQSYLRNAIRHEVLPALERLTGREVRAKLAEAASINRGYWEHTLHPELSRRFQECAAGARRLHIDALGNQPAVWKHRIILEALQKWIPEAPRSRSVAVQIADLISSQVGRSVQFDQVTIWRERGVLLFEESEQSTKKTQPHRLHPGETTSFGDYLLHAENISRGNQVSINDDPWIAQLDVDTLSMPLTIRRWQEGDRIQPLGMDGSKTVSDLLTDCKVPAHRKDRVAVVQDEDGIIWVPGYRMSHRARICPETSNVLELRARYRT